MTAKKTVATVGSAAAIAAAVAFIPTWEGMDAVARRDSIGTGHPVTYCYGQTAELGDVRVGTRFTKKECDEQIAKSLPKYTAPLEICIHVPLPDKTNAALIDAAWNAGPERVCKSPMVAHMNAGNLAAGCAAFEGWIIRSDGMVRPGLIDRRDGEDHGDKRKSEKGLCLEGLREGARTVKVAAAPKPACSWWRRCS